MPVRRSVWILLAAAVLALLLAGAWRLSKSRTTQLFGGLVTRVETDSLLVALTLDDGPSVYGTERTLAVLDSLGVPATFFVTGHEMANHPDLGRRIVQAGHELANHSYSHEPMVLRSPRWVRGEIERTDSLIRAAGYRGPIAFRPPYGKRLVVLPRVLRAMGRETHLWDVEPETHLGPDPSPDALAALAVEQARPGSIVLLHTMYASRDASREALPLIVGGLRERGFRFVTLADLLALRDSTTARHTYDVPSPRGRGTG